MGKLNIWLSAFVMISAQTASAGLTNRYVLKDNAGAAPPYDSLANAAGDIQTAINYAYTVNNETVLVAAATYDTGGTVINSLTNRVYVSKAITVRSINNDPTNTIIKGAWDPVTTNGPAAVRCVYLVAGSSLVGFTLTNGATLSGNVAEGVAGGVWSAAPSATISNCIIVNNTSVGHASGGPGAGGVYNATVFNSVIAGNRSFIRGGGAYGGVFSNCTLAANTCGTEGGGVNAATLYGCVISNNSAAGAGGGAYGSSLYGCTLVNNRATSHGGGAASTDSSPLVMLSNCVVAFNYSAAAGGGVRMGQLFNCLVYSNNPTGIHQSNASNSVFIANLAFNSLDFYNCLFLGYGAMSSANQKLYNCTAVGCNGSGFAASSGSISLYSCISWSNSAADSGVNAFNSCGAGNLYTNSLLGNTTNNPMFVADGSGIGGAHLPGNYRLQPSSPCVNRGTNQSWMTGKVDLDGRPRVRYGTVDMGAYETLYRGAVFKFR